MDQDASFGDDKLANVFLLTCWRFLVGSLGRLMVLLGGEDVPKTSNLLAALCVPDFPADKVGNTRGPLL